jgi:hypothetical protein
MTVETVTSAILGKMHGIGKCQHRFLLHIVRLLLQVRSRINFTNLSRYGGHAEQYYRKWFSKPFDFGGFNRQLVSLFADSELMIGFDPSFLPKSGKHTPGVGYFWSGCAKSVKWGMELCGISIIDLSKQTAYHYEAVQTEYVKTDDGQTLRQYYADLIIQRAEALKGISKVMVFDAFFSTKSFVDSICAAGFTIISRLQHNAFLRYPYIGPQKKGKGRPKVYGGRIDPKNIDTTHFCEVSRTDEQVVYQGKAHVRSLERWVKLVVVQTLKDGVVTKALLYFCADDNPNRQITGQQIARYYSARFLMEFGFRDAKQFMGLSQCQSRHKQALQFHFNIVLTVLNIAKIVHWLPHQSDGRTPFSIADIKTQYANEILLDRLISFYGKDPIVEKNKPEIKKLYHLGRMAA